MDILYQESKGKLFHSMIKWLQDPDEDLKITAVLAMGNFARTGKYLKKKKKKMVISLSSVF